MTFDPELSDCAGNVPINGASAIPGESICPPSEFEPSP
jgi:hypothetical protein